jgi:hypothetical protein
MCSGGHLSLDTYEIRRGDRRRACRFALGAAGLLLLLLLLLSSAVLRLRQLLLLRRASLIGGEHGQGIAAAQKVHRFEELLLFLLAKEGADGRGRRIGRRRCGNGGVREVERGISAKRVREIKVRRRVQKDIEHGGVDSGRELRSSGGRES